jgi:uncharacterized membrane protein
MHFSQTHYLPITPGIFFILAVALGALIILIQLGLLRYAYMRLGVSSRTAFFLLLGSLVGSYFNIPLFELPAQKVVSPQIVHFFGMSYVVPQVEQWPGTMIAVNVGGGIIPTLMSVYLLIHYRFWGLGVLSTLIVTVIVHLLATPVAGLGVAVPVFVPALASAITALVLSRAYAAQLAYISGSLGTLIGADLLNLGQIQGLGAPIASIGGAGTFDGIFLTGILAVLLAGIGGRSVGAHPAG